LTTTATQQSEQKKGSLSQPEIKINILCYLYNKGENGANAYKIQSCVHTHQDSTRFKRLLEELCQKGRLEQKDRSYLHKGLITYNITQKGRETVQMLRNPLVRDIIGTPEDLG
jgi:predicted transcriptional regulator